MAPAAAAETPPGGRPPPSLGLKRQKTIRVPQSVVLVVTPRKDTDKDKDKGAAPARRLSLGEAQAALGGSQRRNPVKPRWAGETAHAMGGGYVGGLKDRRSKREVEAIRGQAAKAMQSAYRGKLARDVARGKKQCTGVAEAAHAHRHLCLMASLLTLAGLACGMHGFGSGLFCRALAMPGSHAVVSVAQLPCAHRRVASCARAKRSLAEEAERERRKLRTMTPKQKAKFEAERLKQKAQEELRRYKERKTSLSTSPDASPRKGSLTGRSDTSPHRSDRGDSRSSSPAPARARAGSTDEWSERRVAVRYRKQGEGNEKRRDVVRRDAAYSLEGTA